MPERLSRVGAAFSHQLRQTLALGQGQALSVRYRFPQPGQEPPSPEAASLVLALLLCAGLYGGFLQRQSSAKPINMHVVAAGLGLLSYIALLLPTTGLFLQHGVTMMTADRYNYLPLLLLGTPALAWLLKAAAFGDYALPATLGTATASEITGSTRQRVVAAVVVAVLAVEMQGTITYSGVWWNSSSLWRHVVSADPTDAPALSELGGALLANGVGGAPVLTEALQWYDAAVALENHIVLENDGVAADLRRFGDIWSNRCLVLSALGGESRSAEALAGYEHAAAVYGGTKGVGFSSPLTEAALYTNWAAMLAGMARHPEAADVLQKAVSSLKTG